MVIQIPWLVKFKKLSFSIFFIQIKLIIESIVEELPRTLTLWIKS